MRTNATPESRLIVALDVDGRNQAMQIVQQLGEAVSFYKVGLQLFMEAGLRVVHDLLKENKKVFLDLKIDDTPRTVEQAVKNAAKHGVHFFTLQGNSETARAAARGRGASPCPQFLQVTYLSSWDKNDVREQRHVPDGVELDLDHEVSIRASRIIEAGCDGVIASGTSIKRLRDAFPGILIVSPGIRPSGTSADDHKRSLTPAQAIEYGADYLVVGRPIRDSSDPKATAHRIQDEIAAALRRVAASATPHGQHKVVAAH
jgi:orotidine-5'-phosphate decarboxylase